MVAGVRGDLGRRVARGGLGRRRRSGRKSRSRVAGLAASNAVRSEAPTSSSVTIILLRAIALLCPLGVNPTAEFKFRST